MENRPILTIDGKTFLLTMDNCVYEWWRGAELLYVGLSTSCLGRIGKHNIIHKMANVLPDDKIEIFWFESYKEAAVYENYMNTAFAP